MRVVWWIVLGALALIAIGAQMDRQSRYSPALASHVPGAFQSFALAHEAAASLDRGDNPEALSLARELVAKRPLAAENLTLLAMAELANGDETAAVQSIDLAGQRGWRVWPLQVSLFGIAMENGNYEVAAMRLAAMWAVPEDREMVNQATSSLLATPEGREAFAQRLAQGGIWTKGFNRRARTANASANDAITLRRAGEINSAER